MIEIPEIEVEVTFLTPEEGGRKQPPKFEASLYRPHLVVGDPGQRRAVLRDGNVVDEEYLGVQFKPDAAPCLPGVLRTATLQLMYHPAVQYERLVAGATFTVREGPRIVGFGRVLSRAIAST